MAADKLKQAKRMSASTIIGCNKPPNATLFTIASTAIGDAKFKSPTATENNTIKRMSLASGRINWIKLDHDDFAAGP
jgi:hypothetical protein